MASFETATNESTYFILLTNPKSHCLFSPIEVSLLSAAFLDLEFCLGTPVEASFRLALTRGTTHTQDRHKSTRPVLVAVKITREYFTDYILHFIHHIIAEACAEFGSVCIAEIDNNS